VKGSKASQSFVCKSCKAVVTNEENTYDNLHIGHAVLLGQVAKLRYLADKLMEAAIQQCQQELNIC